MEGLSIYTLKCTSNPNVFLWYLEETLSALPLCPSKEKDNCFPTHRQNSKK